MSDPELPSRLSLELSTAPRRPRRTVLVTAGLTASASVIAASLLGAQTNRGAAAPVPPA